MKSFIILMVLLPWTNGLQILPGQKTFACNSEELKHAGDYVPKLTQTNFISCENVTSLSLQRNNISVIENHAFMDLRKIKSMDLSFNNISTLPTQIFSSTPEIEDINFAYNNFTFLQRNLFANLSALRSVNFQFNKIINVDENCFVNVPVLAVINLANNYLKTLQLNIIDDIKSLKGINLSGNPWYCDFNLCKTMNTVVSKFWQEPDVPRCNSPDQTVNQTWKQILELTEPVIITDVNNIEKNGRNSSVTMQCYSCSKKTSLKWMFENENVSYVTNQTYTEYLSLSSFTIDLISPSEVGKYICYADEYTPQTSYSIYLLPEYAQTTDEEDLGDSSHGQIIVIFVPIGAIVSILMGGYYRFIRTRENQSPFNFVRFR